MCSGDRNVKASPSPGGSIASTQPVTRACAVMTRTCRLTLNRSRMTPARLSSTSARLPPASRCVRTAVTKNLASSRGTRSPSERSASGIGMPKFCRS